MDYKIQSSNELQVDNKNQFSITFVHIIRWLKDKKNVQNIAVTAN